MPVFINLLLLFILFAILGVAAGFIVKNIKYIASILKIKLFAFGLLLGLITTLPELAVGINATLDNAAALSVGNLLSGIIVILGFILGANLIFSRKIRTDGRWTMLLPASILILSPILLGIDGGYDLLDGLILVSLYIGLVYYLYRINRTVTIAKLKIINPNKIVNAILLSIGGIIIVLLASHWIIKLTLALLNQTNISELAIGVLIFSIGTNLPEITITIASWRKKASELCLSHLLSSAFTNILILGILAAINPITFTADATFWILAIFIIILMFLFLLFYRTNNQLERREGAVLLTIYGLFLIINFYLLTVN